MDDIPTLHFREVVDFKTHVPHVPGNTYDTTPRDSRFTSAHYAHGR